MSRVAVASGHCWPLLGDLGGPRDGPSNGPAARLAIYGLTGSSRARWRACARISFKRLWNALWRF